VAAGGGLPDRINSTIRALLATCSAPLMAMRRTLLGTAALAVAYSFLEPAKDGRGHDP
jgi:hypothetical protein